ncbi:MAG: MFS transporter [Actinobacteria bacterium]|nr:MFS transporter [Actinomycetota bacterium]
MVSRDPRTYTLNPFGRLAAAHACSVVGDACLTVSLAGSIFFTQQVGESRTQVLLYLLLTVAPFAVVGPVIGPALDRSRAGRRTLMAIGCFGRALVCFLMVGQLDSVLLFPLAFVALVLAKGHAVAKSALVPAVVADEAVLVEANSRLSLISVVAAVVGGLPAAALVAILNARPSLLLAAAVFVVGGLLSFRIPAAAKPTAAETSEERSELAVPSIVFAGTAMAVLRGGVGFLTFLLAFLLKQAGQPAWFFGLVLVASAVGGFLGVIVTPWLRRRVNEETILASSLIVPAIVALFAARDGGRLGAISIAFVVAVGASAGRIAFDSLLHRDGPKHLHGRAFARFETRFQLAWVAGALVSVALLDVITKRSGFFLLALVLGFAGLSYVGGLRARHEWGPQRPVSPPSPGPEPLPPTRTTEPVPDPPDNRGAETGRDW